MFNSGLEIIFVILRGGWDYSSWCKAFQYQVCETSSIAVGGRALLKKVMNQCIQQRIRC